MFHFLSHLQNFNKISRKSQPPLIVVSLDGFRAEYLLRNMTPNLKFMSNCGVHAPFMRATFPTKTFPNHYTMATVSTTSSFWLKPSSSSSSPFNRVCTQRLMELLTTSSTTSTRIEHSASQLTKSSTRDGTTENLLVEFDFLCILELNRIIIIEIHLFE